MSDMNFFADFPILYKHFFTDSTQETVAAENFTSIPADKYKPNHEWVSVIYIHHVGVVSNIEFFNLFASTCFFGFQIDFSTPLVLLSLTH